MTKVTIYKEKGKVVKLVSDGHTDYGEEGEDIVCAALSSVIQTAVLGLLQVAAIPLKYEIRDKGAYLCFELPELNETQRHDADVIIDTMLCGISDLIEGYSDFIELEVK
jgi:hypothetical protein